LLLPLQSYFIAQSNLFTQLEITDTRWALIIPYTAMGLPLATFLLKVFMDGLPEDLFDAARIDGASELRTYSRVALPLLRPGLATVAIFSALAAWNEFLLALLYIQDDELKTIPTVCGSLRQALEELNSALDEVRTTNPRGLIIRSAKDNFIAGADVNEFVNFKGADEAVAFTRLGWDTMQKLRDLPSPTTALVNGFCMGGGLELALAGGPIFAAHDAQFGQPEIKLGVFAPAASVLLPYRINQPAAEDLLCSGRSIGAAEAKAIGLVHTVFDDPEIAATAYFGEHLAPHSAASLACAVAAARGPMRRDARQRQFDCLFGLQGRAQHIDAVDGAAAGARSAGERAVSGWPPRQLDEEDHERGGLREADRADRDRVSAQAWYLAGRCRTDGAVPGRRRDDHDRRMPADGLRPASR